MPGFEKSYVMQSGVNVGVRETRRILGDYQLTADDVLSARKFDDAIARGAYPVDIHNPTAPARCSSACRRARPTTSRCAA